MITKIKNILGGATFSKDQIESHFITKEGFPPTEEMLEAGISYSKEKTEASLDEICLAILDIDKKYIAIRKAKKEFKKAYGRHPNSEEEIRLRKKVNSSDEDFNELAIRNLTLIMFAAVAADASLTTEYKKEDKDGFSTVGVGDVETISTSVDENVVEGSFNESNFDSYVEDSLTTDKSSYSVDTSETITSVDTSGSGSGSGSGDSSGSGSGCSGSGSGSGSGCGGGCGA